MVSTNLNPLAEILYKVETQPAIIWLKIGCIYSPMIGINLAKYKYRVSS
jgi:hypothetical protein